MFAEPAAITLGEFTEMGEAAIVGDGGRSQAWQRGAQHAMGLVEAAVAQELMRRHAKERPEA